MCSKKLKIIHLLFDNDARKKYVCKSTIVMDDVPTNDINIIRDIKGQVHNMYNKWLNGYQFMIENYMKKGKKINIDNKIKEVYYKMEVVCEFMKGNSPNPFTLMYDYQLEDVYCHKFTYNYNTKQLIEVKDEPKKTNTKPINAIPEVKTMGFPNANLPLGSSSTNISQQKQINQPNQTEQTDAFKMYSNYYPSARD